MMSDTLRQTYSLTFTDIRSDSITITYALRPSRPHIFRLTLPRTLTQSPTRPHAPILTHALKLAQTHIMRSHGPLIKHTLIHTHTRTHSPTIIHCTFIY